MKAKKGTQRRKLIRVRTARRQAITIPIRLDSDLHRWLLKVAQLSGVAVETVCSVLLSSIVVARFEECEAR